MQYINRLSDYVDSRESAVTFGKFDGLHKGHQKLIEKVRELSAGEELAGIVCAFDMRPLWERTGKIPQMLMTPEEKQRYLGGKAGTLVNCPFSEAFRQIEAEAFIRDIICGTFHARYVVVGTDFQFGHHKRGDMGMLRQYAGEYGYEPIVIEKERYGDRIISSTYIKELLSQGDIRTVSALLGYHYGITGTVEHGRKLGRTLGFPTFNVEWPREKLAPPWGVYLSDILVDGQWFHGISNVGVKPTVSRKERVLIESFLFGYQGEAYGKEVTVRLLQFRRAERAFASVEELRACIGRDVEYGKHFFANEE